MYYGNIKKPIDKYEMFKYKLLLVGSKIIIIFMSLFLYQITNTLLKKIQVLH